MKSNQISIFGLSKIPLIKKGDNISQLIIESLNKDNLSLEDGDILIIAQTIISKANGRIRDLKEIKVSDEALRIYNRTAGKAIKKGIPVKEPELIQAIIDESREIIKAEHVLITETKQGFICANAGIDKSNVEGKNNIALLPINSDEEAHKIREELKKLTKKNVAIIISDSFGRPFRQGAVGVAIGISGIEAIHDKRGAVDLFNHELQSTIIGQVDNLASAAQLMMGESNEGIPIVLLRGYDYNRAENTSIKTILREKNSDLFRNKDILKNRRSYKLEFSKEEVNRELLEECIEISMWAPNAHNGQFWRYIILEKDKIRENLIDEMNKKLRNDLIKDNKSEKFIQNKINKTRSQFLTSPYLILLCLDTTDLEKYTDSERNDNEFILGVQSISSAATYLLLALEGKNIASCWYCAPLFSKETIKNTLRLPESYVPMSFFTVGYSLKEQKAPKRKDLKDIIYEIKGLGEEL